MKKKELLKNIPKNLIHHMVETDSTGWPPHCSTFAYQPVRPHQKKLQHNQTEYFIKKG